MVCYQKPNAAIGGSLVVCGKVVSCESQHVP